MVTGRGGRARGITGLGARRRGARRSGGMRVVGLGFAAIAVVAVAAGLWRWSMGAADPLAPGGTPPMGPAAASAPPAEPAPGDAPAGDVGAGDAGAGDAAALSVVRAAAAATAAAPAMRFTLTLVLTDDSTTPPATEVTGAVDNVTGNVAVTLREWGAGPGSTPTTLEAVAVGDALYVRSSALDPPGAPPVWWRVPADGSGQGTPAMVSGLVALVGTAVSAESVGMATVEGIEVRRLRVEFPGDGPAPGVVGSASGWGLVGVDGDGRLRSLEAQAVGAWGQAAGREVLVRLVLDPSGDPVGISAPDPAEVRDPAAGLRTSTGAAGAAAVGVRGDSAGG